MNKDAKIFVSSHSKLIGSALVRKLQEKGFTNFVFFPSNPGEKTNQEKIFSFFETEKPDYVFLSASKRGGIMASKTHPADFLYESIQLEINILHAAFQHKVKKLLFIGSSDMYPRLALQPIRETALLTGEMEQTQEAAGISSLVGIKYCEYLNRQYNMNFISVIPASLYGKEDFYHLVYSHVIPGLLQRFHEAKMNQDPIVYVWGTGNVIRDFLFADDLADACVFLMNYYEGDEKINVGSGSGITIKELAEMIKETVQYEGKIVYDSSKPVGMPRKILDVSRLDQMGWTPDTDLKDGIQIVYKDLLSKAIN